MNKYVAGALAGTIATIPMTLTMLSIHRQIPKRERRELPPEQITESIAHKVGAGRVLDDEPEQKTASLVNHFGYGAATGLIYSAFEDFVELPPVTKGVAWGLAVWAGSYLGWLPAAGILPPATEKPASENAMMITSHIVWGAALGAVLEQLRGET